MLRSPMGSHTAPCRTIGCHLLRASSVASNSTPHRARRRMLVVRGADDRAARSRGGEFIMGTSGRAGGCQHVGGRAASTRVPLSPNHRRRHRLCCVYISLRRPDVLVAMARRPSKRTQILELAEGMVDVCRRWTMSYRWEDWRNEVPWMSLYFTFGVWTSIWLVRACI